MVKNRDVCSIQYQPVPVGTLDRKIHTAITCCALLCQSCALLSSLCLSLCPLMPAHACAKPSTRHWALCTPNTADTHTNPRYNHSKTVFMIKTHLYLLQVTYSHDTTSRFFHYTGWCWLVSITELKDKGSAITSGLVKTDSIPLCMYTTKHGHIRHVFLP